MKYLYSLLSLIFFISYGLAQDPVLLKDFRTNGASAFPYDPFIKGLSTGNMLFFLAETPDQGEELYRTNGTEIGTQFLKDIRPGEAPSSIRFLATIGDSLFFAASDGENGYELWVSVGTTSSTLMVEDLNEGNSSGIRTSRNSWIVFENDLYFAGNNGSTGTELYKYDLETKSTSLVRDLDDRDGGAGNTRSSNPENFTLGEEVFYFTAQDSSGRELWRTDGTPQNTGKIADLNPGPGSTAFYEMKVVGGSTLVFLADDGIAGEELWISLGSALFTVRLDLTPGPESSDIRLFDLIDDRFYFTKRERFSDYLYSTNGSEGGTQKVLTSDGDSIRAFSPFMFQEELYFRGPGSRLWKINRDGELVENITSFSVFYGADMPAILNDTLLYFFGSSSEGNVLYQSNGTSEGTTPIDTVNRRSFYDVDNLFATESHVFFIVETDSFGREIFVSDGTIEGTGLLIDSKPGPEDGFESYEDVFFHAIGNQFIFPGYDDIHGREIWTSDGTVEGTRLLRDLNTQTEDVRLYSDPTELGNKTFFSTDEGLWETDGTSEGTQLVWGEGPAYGLNAVGDKLLMRASTPGVNSLGLVVSDGTAEGTKPLFDSATAAPLRFIIQDNDPVFNGRLYFMGREPDTDYELWSSDGTSEGTSLVKDIGENNFGFNGFSGARFAVFNNELYFATNDGVIGFELWKTDGTEEGTVAVADINPFGSGLPGKFAVLGDELFFIANDGTGGDELWKTDGSQEGTELVKDIFPGEPDDDGLGNTDLVPFNGKLYFAATDGENGTELWVSDGTEEGTLLFKDFIPGGAFSQSGGPRFFYSTDSLLYFTAKDTSGTKLWKTDGTLEGTVPAVEIQPTSELVAAGDYFFFRAFTEENGQELWRSNGTPEGTFLVKDIFDGPNDSSPILEGFVNDVLYFTATDPDKGRELFALSPLRIQGKVTADTEEICSVADSITFTAEVRNAGDNPTLRWYVNGQLVPNQNSSVFRAAGLADGTQVSLEIIADQSVWTLSEQVFIEGLPVGISGLNPEITVQENQLTANEAASYRWFLDGNLISDTSQTIIATTSGNYQVEITNIAGCTALSEEVSLTVTNTADPRLVHGIRLYPNPVRAQLFLESDLNEPVDVSVIAATGQTVYRGRMQSFGSQLNIPMDQLAKGLYLIRLQTSRGWHHRRILKQ